MYMGIGEQLFELSNGNYIFVQDYSEGGYDFEYIDGDTRLGIDGGVLEDECNSDEEVMTKIMDELGLSDCTYGLSSLDYYEDFA